MKFELLVVRTLGTICNGLLGMAGDKSRQRERLNSSLQELFEWDEEQHGIVGWEKPETQKVECGMSKKNGLSFMEAVEAMSAGKKVRRASWDYEKEICPFEPRRGGRRIQEKTGSQWSPMIEDLEANDWQIVE